MRKWVSRLALWAYVVVMAALLVASAWMLLRTYCLASFTIPTDSMEPAILPGDYILASRVRLDRIKRNDVVFFKFPYPGAWDSLSTEGGLFYAKRCVGLPGDTIEIHGGIYKVRGCDMTLGDIASQRMLAPLLAGITEDSVARSFGICLDAWPPDNSPGWTILEFGPLLIPSAGTTVAIDSTTLPMYRNVIEWETGRKISEMPGLRSYTFEKNYYFVAGDRAENSQDSRYWGLLPEEHIKAKGLFVWKSEDPCTGRLRWNRLLCRMKPRSR